MTTKVNSSVIGTIRDFPVTGNLTIEASTVSTSTSTGALVITGGAGIGGNLVITTAGDVSANIGRLFLGNTSTNANLGAYQTFANANVSSLQDQITGANTNIQTTSANLGAYQTFANSNVASLQNQITGANTNIQTTSANLGAFQTYANSKIGTNTNSNLVVPATTTSTSTTTGALVVGGGIGVAGNISIGGQIPTTVILNNQNFANQIQFWSSGVERARIGPDSAGNFDILVGSTTAPAIEIAPGSPGNVVIFSTTTSTSTTTGGLVVRGGAGVAGNVNIGAALGVGTAASATTGEIRASNNITAYFSSDAKFKENVRPIPNALDKVLAIGGKLFDWTDEYVDQHGGADGYFVRKQDFGVIGQDVERVFPEGVRRREDGSIAVDYEKLSALAFAAIVELTEIVNELKSR